MKTSIRPSVPVSLSLSAFQPAHHSLSPHTEERENQIEETKGIPAQVDPDRACVSIVSNSRILRDGLVQLLAPYIDLYLMGRYTARFPNMPIQLNTSSMNVLVNSLTRSRPIVLLDGGMGQEPALIWIRYWQSQSPQAYILVVEAPNDNDMILACVEAGAHGYMLRDSSAAQLAEAIEQAQQGVVVCSPEVAIQLCTYLDYSGMDGPAKVTSGTTQAQSHIHTFEVPVAHGIRLGNVAPVTPLTARELEVLSHISANHSNKEIAEALVIEVHTVKHHVHSILQKLKLRNRWYAAQLAIEQGWFDVPLHLHQSRD